MTPAEQFLSGCIAFGLGAMCLSLLLTTLRVIKGPTLPDRVLALDMLVAIAIGFIALLGIQSGYGYYVDIAIALGLVGFLATVALARFIAGRPLSAGAAPRAQSSHDSGAAP